MQKHHGDVSNGAIYISLPLQTYLGIKKEFDLYSLITKPEIREPWFCFTKKFLSKSWEACAGRGCKTRRIWLRVLHWTVGLEFQRMRSSSWPDKLKELVYEVGRIKDKKCVW